MLSKVLQDAINDQIKDEFYAAYLYLAMSAHFETVHLPGCARWMRGQSQEEASHAMKLFEFVHERGGACCVARHQAAACQLQVASRCVSAGAGARARSDWYDPPPVRTGGQGE